MEHTRTELRRKELTHKIALIEERADHLYDVAPTKSQELSEQADSLRKELEGLDND